MARRHNGGAPRRRTRRRRSARPACACGAREGQRSGVAWACAEKERASTEKVGRCGAVRGGAAGAGRAREMSEDSTLVPASRGRRQPPTRMRAGRGRRARGRRGTGRVTSLVTAHLAARGWCAAAVVRLRKLHVHRGGSAHLRARTARARARGSGSCRPAWHSAAGPAGALCRLCSSCAV